MITNSLQWNTKRIELKTQIQNLPYNPELRKMLQNIDILVNKLSKAEVEARRNHRDFSELEELQQVNDAIQILEKWIIMGSLITQKSTDKPKFDK